MANSRSGAISIKIIMVLGVFVSALAAQRLYFMPRYGGIMAYFLAGNAAGSAAGRLDGQLSRIQSTLSIYYGDSDGKYPPSLDVLWGGRNYLEGPMPREDVFIETESGKFKRAHWYRDSAAVKIFNSRADADDSGGWGYVADQASPEWGTVFVNCTHPHLKKGVPWNLSSPPAPQASPKTDAAGAAI